MDRSWRFVISLIVLGIGIRLIPHLANFTPMFAIIGLCFRLYSPAQASLLCATIIVCSDMLLLFKPGIFIGSWIIINYFTYAILCILSWVLSALRRQQAVSSFFFLLFDGVVLPALFWVLTNFGIWYFYDWYPPNLTGLGYCYILALPFLYSSLLASLLFSYMFKKVLDNCYLRKIMLLS